VKLDAVRKCVLFSAGFFAFVHGALLAGRILGSSSETTAAVRNNARPLTGDNYTDPGSLAEDDDVSRRPRVAPRDATSFPWQDAVPLPTALSTQPMIDVLLYVSACLSPQPLDTAMRIIVNGVALIGNVCGASACPPVTFALGTGFPTRLGRLAPWSLARPPSTFSVCTCVCCLGPWLPVAFFAAFHSPILTFSWSTTPPRGTAPLRRVAPVCVRAGFIGTNSYMKSGEATAFKVYMGYLLANCLFCAGYTLRAIMVHAYTCLTKPLALGVSAQLHCCRAILFRGDAWRTSDSHMLQSVGCGFSVGH
jgi:hypothetical protein